MPRAAYQGYDMEDAMIINKSSFERGFAHGMVYKSDTINLEKNSKNKGSGQFRFYNRLDDKATQVLKLWFKLSSEQENDFSF